MSYPNWAVAHRIMVTLLGALCVIPGVLVLERGGLHGVPSGLVALITVIVVSAGITRAAWFFAPDGRRARR